MCVVELEGKDRLITACNNICEEGMVIYTNSPKVRKDRRTTVELILSAQEDISVLLNGTDHIRIQAIRPGMDLSAALKDADQIDDYVDERFSYAFDEKYGYLTSYPTNVGTGMRASVLIHLPSLSLGKKFQAMLGFWRVSPRCVW